MENAKQGNTRRLPNPNRNQDTLTPDVSGSPYNRTIKRKKKLMEDWKMALAEIQKSMREDFISQIKTNEKETN
jgi:hypothetical protein